MRNDNRGVSKIIGVVILVVIVIMLSVGVLFTAQTLIGDQPQDMTAGTTDERVDFYTHEAQLVNQGNTDTVYAISPLGTEYKLEDAGDLQKILPLAKDSHPGVDQYQIVGERDGQRQLLKTNHFEEGVKPDVVVHDDGDKDYESIQTAINNIDDDTERDISSDNPGVIVVQKGVYKENIEVSDDINLIAEYGTVIQDANPNEDVVDIRGDNVRFQNFEVDGNPDPEDEDHYARHGINVQGSDAVIQGNTIRRAASPDVTSAAVRVNDKNSVVRYNNMLNSQQSINFGSDSVSPAVCGNQFEDGIGGALTTQTQRDVATLNHWNDGLPSNLARTVIAAEQQENTDDGDFTLPSEAPKELLENTNSRVDPTILGDDAGRAALPFTGTKMGTSSTPGECELSIGLVNTDSQSINIEEIQVTINGQKTTIEVVEEVNLGSGESADTRDGPTATCDCGGDGTYDPGDRISISESSFGEIQTYTTEGEFEPLPFTEGEGSEPTPSSFNVEPPGGTPITTSSTTDTSSGGGDDGSSGDDSSDSDSPQSDDGSDEPDFRILLGSSVDINLADEVILEPVISGAESPQDEIQYEWDLGDGSTSTDRVVRHVYDDPGTYTVELTVTDPATGETDTDSTTVTVEEGTKDVEKIRSDEQQRLADLVEEDPDGDGKVLYLEEGTEYTSLSTISAQDLTIIGQGEDVTLDGPITVESSGVTFKNVAINNGLVVQNNDFKLYNSKITNSGGYAVELNANGGGFQIGDSTLTGEDGLYLNVDDDVLVSGSTITGSGTYGLYTEEDISNVRIRENTIESNDIGIYESLAVNGEYERNEIIAPTQVEKQESQDPVVEEINVEFTTTDVPLALSTEVRDPDGYGIDEVTWEVNGETYTRDPSNDLIYTFDDPGEYTISVTVTDKFGNTVTDSKTVTIDEFEATLTTAEEASQNDDVTASVDYNIPDYRVQSIEYDWGDGNDDIVGSSSYEHAYTEKGDFDVSVTVNPDEGESRTVSDSISIVDSPVAEFDIEDSLLAGEPIQFNGGYSTAPDGGNLDYTWNMGDGTTYTSESPKHTYGDTGTYDVTLTVEDSDGYTSSKTVQLDIRGFTVEATGPSTVGEGNDAEFDVSTSIGDSNIDQYIIDSDGDGEGEEAKSSTPFTYAFSSTGEREVAIEAVSDDGYAVSDTVVVDVVPSPSFDVSVSSTSVQEGEELTVEATNVDADSPSYDWDFGDGTTETGKTASNTYSSGGEYTITSTVTNNNGIETEETVDVTVTKAVYSSCQDVANTNPSASSGMYTIDPDGAGGVAPFDVSCEMTEDGGGWVKLSMTNAGSDNVWAIDHGGGYSFQSNCGAYDNQDEKYYTGVDGDLEWGYNTNTGTSRYHINYKSGSNSLSNAQEQALRSEASQMSGETRSVALTCDDDGHSKSGHEVRLVDGNGNTWQATDEAVYGSGYIGFWNHGTQASDNSFDAIDTSFTNAPDSSRTVPSNYIIPDEVEVYIDSGGAASWGYEKDYVLVKLEDEGSSETTKTVDNFEDGDLSEYDSVYGPGNGNTNVVTDTVYEGNHALEFESYDGSTSVMESPSGLDYYPTYGDDLTLYHYPDTTNSRPAVAMTGVDTNGNQVSARWAPWVGEEFRMDLPDGTTISDSNANIPTDEWLRLEIETTTDGYTEARLYSASDGTHISTISGTSEVIVASDAGLQWQQAVTGGGTSRSYWDYYRADP